MPNIFFLNNMRYCLVVKMSHFIDNFHHFFFPSFQKIRMYANWNRLLTVTNKCSSEIQLGSVQFDFTDKDVSIEPNDAYVVWLKRFFFIRAIDFFFLLSSIEWQHTTRQKNVWHRNVLKLGTYAIKVLFYHDRKKKWIIIINISQFLRQTQTEHC